MKDELDLDDPNLFKGSTFSCLEANWVDDGIEYHGLSYTYGKATQNQSLGLQPIDEDTLKAHSEEVINKVERLLGVGEGTSAFQNLLEEARAYCAEFANNILSPDASKFLFEKLSTPDSLVVLLLLTEHLKGVPWELCHLGDRHASRGGFINELGTFERGITTPPEAGPRMSGQSVSFIIDKVLESEEKNEQLIHRKLNVLGIFDRHVHIEEFKVCGEVLKESDSIVYLGHHSPRGIQLSPELCYPPEMLRTHPFPYEGVCVLASCRDSPVIGSGIEDLSRHNQLATGIGERCRCNVIYSLTKIPLKQGLDIAANCFKALHEVKCPTLLAVWKELQGAIGSPYLWFFCMHGTWYRILNKEGLDNENHSR